MQTKDTYFQFVSEQTALREKFYSDIKDLHAKYDSIEKKLKAKAFEVSELKEQRILLSDDDVRFYFHNHGVEVVMVDYNGDYIDECLVTWEQLNDPT